MNDTKKGWLIIIAAFVITVSADYILRRADGDITTGGIPVELFWIIVLVPTLFSFKLFYQGMLSRLGLSKRMVYLMAQAFLVFIVLAAGSYLYVVMCGIDAV